MQSIAVKEINFAAPEITIPRRITTLKTPSHFGKGLGCASYERAQARSPFL